jgi:hypothetical protein
VAAARSARRPADGGALSGRERDRVERLRRWERSPTRSSRDVGAHQ